MACCRIGTEHEKLAFRLSDHSRIQFDTVSRLFNELERLGGWQRIYEGGSCVGMTSADGQSVTLEPGCQVELSGATRSNLHQVVTELEDHLRKVSGVAAAGALDKATRAGVAHGCCSGL